MIIKGYDSIEPRDLYAIIIFYNYLPYNIGITCLITRNDIFSSIYLGVYLISSIFVISFAFSKKMEDLAVPIIIFIYNCFAIVLSFFGNVYVIIITVGISFCSMIFIWALIEKGDAQDVLIHVGILIAIFDLYSCIAVNMDTAKWIEVIYWIFFGIFGIASVLAIYAICFLH